MMMRSYGCRLLPPLGPLLVILFLVLVLPDSTPAAAQGGASSSRWLTLSENEPAVIARGGFSGLFPESSYYAYEFIDRLQLPSTTLWCDVQMTKDAVGVCLTDVNLSNCTDISFPYSKFKDEKQTYVINGRNLTGWFPVDYTYDQLKNVALIRSILSRPPNYDMSYIMLTVIQAGEFNQNLWLNIQHDLFYKEHDLNITKCIIAVSRNVSVAYISSPEVDFLKRIFPTFSGTTTKLIFHIPDDEKIDPSTNQTYESLLKNLTFIKTFASGILIPKSYIWREASLFLKRHTSIVTDAHDVGLEVFASGFANDFLIAYNYSYDPVTEYLKFIDNGNFSVDGLVSDFPSTAWEAIRCFSHLGSNTSTNTPLVITHNGDSGDYPTCTDRAYMKAIKGGADVIDCSVQVTKDGLLICLSSINLQSSTTVSRSPFGTRLSTIPEIQAEPGIFSFNFTWEEIQNTLKPEISNPFLAAYTLRRNPANQNAGKFMNLDGFLELAKDQNVSRVMITVENAYFLVDKLGVDIIDLVTNALNNAGFNNQTSTEVMIQSSNSSTLIAFKQKTKYNLVYKLDELVRDVDLTALDKVKEFADAVAVKKSAIFRTSKAFFTSETNLVKKLHSAKLKVYVYVLKNEFISTPWDFLGDATTEIHNFVEGAGVDGVITDFPATSDRYRRNTCSKGNYSIPLMPPGLLIEFIVAESAVPPTLPPLPSLDAPSVLEPDLPKPTPPKSQSPPSAQPCTLPSPLFILLTISVGLLWSLKW